MLYPPLRSPAERKAPVNPLPAHPVPGAIDVTRPHPARMYDYYLGGKDHWPADKEAADKVLAAVPEVRAIARANRGFLRRAVTYLARDKGITQFLDIGTGIPTAPDVILAGARAFLDFTQPVALLLVAIMHFIPDAQNPAGILAAYRDALPPGSYLALSHGTSDFHDAEVTGAATSTYDTATAPLVLRPKAAIAALLDGFTPVPPGLVQAPLWRPDTVTSEFVVHGRRRWFS